MGYMKHDAVVVTTGSHRPGGLPDMDAFRESLPKEMRALVIGPVPTPVNDLVSYAFLPDGSKEGWGASDEGDEARNRFKDLFRALESDGSSADDWVHVEFGDDHAELGEATFVEVHPPARAAS